MNPGTGVSPALVPPGRPPCWLSWGRGVPGPSEPRKGGVPCSHHPRSGGSPALDAPGDGVPLPCSPLGWWLWGKGDPLPMSPALGSVLLLARARGQLGVQLLPHCPLPSPAPQPAWSPWPCTRIPSSPHGWSAVPLALAGLPRPGPAGFWQLSLLPAAGSVCLLFLPAFFPACSAHRSLSQRGLGRPPSRRDPSGFTPQNSPSLTASTPFNNEILSKDFCVFFFPFQLLTRPSIFPQRLFCNATHGKSRRNKMCFPCPSQPPAGSSGTS